jgi:hypothetical protein
MSRNFTPEGLLHPVAEYKTIEGQIWTLGFRENSLMRHAGKETGSRSF